MDKTLNGTHINRTVYLNVKGEHEVTGVLAGFEYVERELPREPNHPLMGFTTVPGVELHIGHNVYFVRDDAPDVALVFLTPAQF